ncbi:LpqB family beta-propeller domain-containing protein [Gordonia phosphorivorans]|uniref:LpqB family beta-propeller domain-containing protein n=1 Tax=Gordonia phosphorivorans TaxID=1056982 RepID=A0ABV6H5Z2_9ACTN
MRVRLPRVVAGWMVTLAMVLTVTGCVAIPNSSAPQPVEGFNRSLPTNLVPTPRRSDDPESLVRNFFKAMADPASGHAASRRFLTPGASERWDDQGPMTILSETRVVVDERSESAVRLRVLGEKTGTLSPIGRLTQATGAMVIPLTLTKQNGAWRVSGDMPAGTITDSAQFDATYRLAELFFPDRTATRLIGDPRWLYGLTVDPTNLLNRLLAGPAPDLTGAVATAAEKDVELRGPVAVEGDRVSVNLGGPIDADARNRTVLAAQLIWTLEGAGIRGTYLISADGVPLIADRSDGWRTADVEAFDPDPGAGDQPLHVLRGGLFRVTPSGPVPVAGPLGTATDLRAAAISAKRTRVAAVAEGDGGQVLLQGPYGGEVTEVLAAAEITSPSFGALTDTGYALVDGRPVQWTVGDGPARVVPLDFGEVTAAYPGRITAFRVSPDGVRAALLVGGRVLFAALSVSDRGAPSLTGVSPATFGAGTPVGAIAWGGATTLYVTRAGTETPVLRIRVSGLPPLAMVSGNLKPPVGTVAATRSTVYVADVRSVMELGTAPGSADQYWTSAGQAPEGAVPVVQAG